MGKNKFCMAALAAIWIGSSLSLLAAEERRQPQNPSQVHQEPIIEPYYWIVWEDQVKPDQRGIYEEKVQAIINKVKQSPNPIQVLTFYESSTSKYYFFYPYKNIQEWNRIFSFWRQETGLEQINNYLQNYSIFISQTVPELSHITLNRQLSMANPNYLRVDKFQIYPNQEQKFIDLLKEWVSLTYANAPECGWFVQKILVDHDLPAYLVLWGDCLKSKENTKHLEKFLIEKQAYGTVIKKIISEDKLFVPKLSTVPLKIF